MRTEFEYFLRDFFEMGLKIGVDRLGIVKDGIELREEDQQRALEIPLL